MKNTDWISKIPRAETVILALGCTLKPDPPHDPSSSTMASTKKAVEVQQRLTQPTPIIFVGSGYRQAGRWGNGESKFMVREARHLHPAGSYYEEPYSFSTPGNAEAIAAYLLRNPQVHTAYLVSDPIHSWRAWFTFVLVLWFAGVRRVKLIRTPGDMPKTFNGDKWYIRNKFIWVLWNWVIAPVATPIHIAKMLIREHPLDVPPLSK